MDTNRAKEPDQRTKSGLDDARGQDKAGRVNGEQPYNVAAKDVPLTHLIVRTPDPNAPPPARPKPKPQAVIDHFALTVADFNRDRARAELLALGVKNVRDGGPRALHMDDVFGYDVQICGLENSALTDG